MKLYQSLDSLFNDLTLKDGLHLSFHHHLRNGDQVLNPVLNKIAKENITALHLFPSAIFPTYTSILDLLKLNRIHSITTNYLNGPVAEYLAKNPLQGELKMQTHGGRARAIIEGETHLDIAFIACPTVDKNGNGTGFYGQSACGSLGYAIEDTLYAKEVILVTDNLVDHIDNPQIKAEHVNKVVVLPSIGDVKGIVSGTTTLTNDPIGINIARNASKLMFQLGLVKQNFSFQSGAGGISLRVTENVKEYLKTNQIKASFFSGGITKYHVDMLEENLVDILYDVQCFDLDAVKSIAKNPRHKAISANDYANPNNPNAVINALDVVILGATEIDLDFNVNVTTDSYNTIIGGSGGHSDTASSALVSIIVTPLLKARTPIIKKHVNTITTLGKHVDCIVTERGIAVNPARQDLIEKLKSTDLDIVSIETLMARAHHYTGVPEDKTNKYKKIGVVEDRDGTIIDTLYTKE